MSEALTSTCVEGCLLEIDSGDDFLTQRYPLVISHFAMENHHAIHGKIHYISMVIFNSYVSHYQRVSKMGICQYQYTMFVGEVLGTLGTCENFQQKMTGFGESVAESVTAWFTGSK